MSAPELLQPGDVVESLTFRHVPRLDWIVRSVETKEPGTQSVHASGHGIGSVIFTWHAPGRIGHYRNLTFRFKERPAKATLAERFMAAFNCEAEGNTNSRLYMEDAKNVEAALRAILPKGFTA